jgi:hypothetical protein
MAIIRSEGTQLAGFAGFHKNVVLLHGNEVVIPLSARALDIPVVTQLPTLFEIQIPRGLASRYWVLFNGKIPRKTKKAFAKMWLGESYLTPKERRRIARFNKRVERVYYE